MLVIGLTGGIGTGKSEAARYMVTLGAELIDADVVGHEAYRPHAEAWSRVVDAFGQDILGPDNEIDRRALGAIVFSDPEQLKRLNGIMHPLMAGMVQEKIDAFRKNGAEVVVVEAALLFEAGMELAGAGSLGDRLPGRRRDSPLVATKRHDGRRSPQARFLADEPRGTPGAG